ncbi:MAG: hypothetical protein VX529_06695 [Pseudomonadota bacterium]|nr:hypothetical protein [Pseudomonadota bacterium]
MTVREAAEAADNAMGDIGKVFGAPGDYGYGTKEGDALFALSKARAALWSALQDSDGADSAGEV